MVVSTNKVVEGGLIWMGKNEFYSKVVNFPKDMQKNIEKAAEIENRSATNFIINVVKKDIEEKKNRGEIKD